MYIVQKKGEKTEEEGKRAEWAIEAGIKTG